MTPEQQARIDRFKAIVQFASQQTGVVPIAIPQQQTIRLPNGTPRIEVTAFIDYAVLADWTPPNETAAETLSTSADTDSPE